MPIFAGALILGGLCGAYVYYGHADLLWLPVYILGGAVAIPIVVGLLVAVVMVGMNLARKLTHASGPAPGDDFATAVLRDIDSLPVVGDAA